MGVTESVDVGVWGSLDPNSNYGLFGLESKIGIVRAADDMPFDLALRPHVGMLVGPEDVTVANFSADVVISRAWWGIAPFLGVGGALTTAFEHADDVDLDTGVGVDGAGFAGVEYRWTYLSAALQAELATNGMATYSGRLSAAF